VVVEHPTFPPLLDLLEQIGVEVIGVPLDDEGIDTDGLRLALEQAPSAVFLQPRAQNPTGVNMSARRAADVAATIAASCVASTVTVIEDDHAGDIASGELHSIGRHLPGRTVHIRSYSKSHGPDLRLAAVGGSGDVISRAANRRLLGPGWSSRILQAVLLELLDDHGTLDALARSREEYAKRRRTVVEILNRRNVHTTGTDGINLWVRVANERSALMALAAQGIGAAPGEPFLVLEHPDSLRVTVGLLGPNTDIVGVAEAVASAAVSSGEARRGQR
jgi:DNA-binding transcriptional MocR family regulator